MPQKKIQRRKINSKEMPKNTLRWPAKFILGLAGIKFNGFITSPLYWNFGDAAVPNPRNNHQTS